MGIQLPFDRACLALGIARPIAEYPFAIAIGRHWRFDWAWPTQRVALEIDGGGFVRGRHHRPAGFAADCEKLNEAAIAGWLVLRCTPQQLRQGIVFEWVSRALMVRRS